MAKELVTKERSQKQEGWMKWLKEALADGAARAHLWTKEPVPWKPEVVDNSVTLEMPLLDYLKFSRNREQPGRGYGRQQIGRIAELPT